MERRGTASTIKGSGIEERGKGKEALWARRGEGKPRKGKGREEGNTERRSLSWDGEKMESRKSTGRRGSTVHISSGEMGRVEKETSWPEEANESWGETSSE